MNTVPEITTVEELRHQPEEYQAACKKIVVSHAINELYGSRVYDEPAIALAKTPYQKWLTCRIVMEEYGHHYRFFELGREMGVPEKDMLPELTAKKPLSIFEHVLESFEQFCVIKMIGDLAEIIQVEDLLHCTFHPLRNLARMTMPEERFHAQFGEDFCTDFCETEEGRETVQRHINLLFPSFPSFFGRPNSKNNEIYRKWGIKKRTNEEMREDYINRTRDLVEGKLNLILPEPDAIAA